MATVSGSILAIDYGEVRIGLALASQAARIAHPHMVLTNSDSILDEFEAIIVREDIIQLVLGLPRSLDGEDTAQTKIIREFQAHLESLGVPVALQDEAGTSARAHFEMKQIKTKKNLQVDSLAASYILEDYLGENYD
ncbi:Holliday junction resolvase RuvX [Candidatus Saccharibacteria bacterium]|nr:Holliday junction resolvase RuvX [Candidatus Saccharibacteria bacterium]